ncbi:MAG TPA: hypothetical protein VFW09_03570 [Solirubrobacteraceae bacterium]|nr:hypothetical protein [Solirubrobacteraceae bacterium]
MTVNAVECLGARHAPGGRGHTVPCTERAGAGYPSWARWNSDVPERYTIAVALVELTSTLTQRFAGPATDSQPPYSRD